MKSIYKKWAALVVVGCVALSSLGAADFSLSAGGGGFFNANFGTEKVSAGGSDHTVKTNTVGGGAFLYFDATYAEIDLNILLGSQSDDREEHSEDISMTHFGFSVLGKYPIGLGAITLFPLAGIDYQLFLSGKSGDTEIKADDDIFKDDGQGMFDLFSISLGAGLDYGLTDALYLRAEALFNIKLNSKAEQKSIDDAPEGYDVSIVNLGPRVKVGVGYKF